MAGKKDDGKLHVSIDEIENGFEVSCYRDQKPSLSQRAGWVPSCCGNTKRYSFPTLEKALAHIKEESK